jgi:methylamine--corrinoid protein Co-methyltransferase
VPPWRIKEVLERAEEGPICEEREFDLRILTPKLNEVIKKYDIRFDPDNIIQSDDSLADDLYEAALELFLEIGTYCTSSHRRILFDESEIKEAMSNHPGKFLVGAGKDAKELSHRGVEDSSKPFCMMGPMGLPCSEELFVPICTAYIQEPIADAVTAPALDTLDGRLIKVGSPTEVRAAVAHSTMLKQAARKVGRPGIFCTSVATAPSDAAQISASNENWGEKLTDGRFVGALAELKVNYDLLRKMTHFVTYGCYIGALTGPLLGGYAGGPEGTAVIGVAYHFQGLMVHQAHYQCSFPLHIKHVCDTTPALLWSTGVISQAIARNTPLITFAKGKAAGGPCTDMVLYEAAAHGLVGTASGANLYVLGPAKNRIKDGYSPVEAKMACEVGHAVARMHMKRSDANQIVKEILKNYENKFEEAPVGKKFNECYDVKKVRPTQEYNELYNNIKKKLVDLGIEFEH